MLELTAKTVDDSQQGTVKMKKSENSVSELLMSAREAKKLSVSDLAKETCISICYLKAIEAGDYDALPAQTFTIGFIKSCAQVLGLDSTDVIAKYKAEVDYKEPADPFEVKKVSADDFKSKSSKRRIGWLSPAIAAMGIAGLWSVLSTNVATQTMLAENTDIQADMELAKLEAIQLASNESTATPVKAVQVNDDSLRTGAITASLQNDTVIADAVDQPTVSAQSTGNIEQLPAQTTTQSLFTTAVYAEPTNTGASANDVTITAIEDSWVRLARADGSEVWSGILNAGEQYNPHLEAGVFFSTSNAGAVRLTIGQTEMPPLGDAGEVISSTPLDEIRAHNIGG